MTAELIDRARRAQQAGDGAKAKELAFQFAFQRLNEITIAQWRRGEFEGAVTRPHWRKDRLIRIMEHDLFRDEAGEPLQADVLPMSCEALLSELESL
ncbi:MAG: hypothetical protein IH985_06590 [Planctomycetes bacterium]|nr:hypothetical protein [Planctomycetota bacterium]